VQSEAQPGASGDFPARGPAKACPYPAPFILSPSCEWLNFKVLFSIVGLKHGNLHALF
jgi:hypothetical protein